MDKMNRENGDTQQTVSNTSRVELHAVIQELDRISPEELEELGHVDFSKYFDGLTEPVKRQIETAVAELEQRAQEEDWASQYERLQQETAKEKEGVLRLEAKHIVNANAPVQLEGRTKEEARLLFDLVQEETAKKQRKQAIAEAHKSAPMRLLDETAEAVTHAENGAAAILKAGNSLAGMTAEHPLMAGGLLMMLMNGGGGGDLIGKGFKIALLGLGLYMLAPDLFEKVATGLGIRDYFNDPPKTPIWKGHGDTQRTVSNTERVELHAESDVGKDGKKATVTADGLGTEPVPKVAENEPESQGEPEMSQEPGKTEAGAAVHLTAEEAEAVAHGAVGDVALQTAKAGGVSPKMADAVTRADGKDFDAVLDGFIKSAMKNYTNTRSM